MGLVSCLFSSALVHASLHHKGTFLYRIKPCFSPTMHNNFFLDRDQSYIRYKSEVDTVSLVEAFQNVYSFAESSKAVQIFLIIFHVFMLSSPGDILC